MPDAIKLVVGEKAEAHVETDQERLAVGVEPIHQEEISREDARAKRFLAIPASLPE
jgi:hypothetical protein